MSKGNGSSNRTQIIIAIIGLIGVLGAALIANWTSVFGPSGSEPSASPPSVVPTVIQDQPADDSSPSTDPPQPETGVDISFVGWALEPQTPIQQQSLLVRVGVENLGTEPSGAFKVEWWAGVNFAEPAKVWEVSNLAPGENQNLNYTYPGYTSWYGQIQTKVIIDPDDSVQDFDRGNNEWVRTISVSQQ